MATVTISADWSTYQNTIMPGWWAIQNPYNKGSLVNGVDYTQSLTCDTTNFPNGTVINWSWPNTPASGNVYGYPEVVYGNQGGGSFPSPDGQAPTPVQIKNLVGLTGTYNYTLGGDSSLYDVLWETHLTSGINPGTNVCEFAILLHSPAYFRNFLANSGSGFTAHSYTNGSFSGTIYTGSNGITPYFLAQPDVESTSGTFDILAYLNWAISNGLLTGNEYIQGFELGVEPQQGTGSLTINSISYAWNTPTSANVSFTPAAAALALTAASPVIITTNPAQYASSAQNFLNGSTTHASVTAVLPTTNPGDFIPVWVRWGSATATMAVGDSIGNTYSNLPAVVDSTNGGSAQLFFCTNKGSGSNTITATPSAATLRLGIIAANYSGVTTSIDQSAHTTTATPDTGAAPTTTNANDLVFGASASTSGDATWTAGAGYTQRNSNVRMSIEDQIVTATGVYDASWTATGGAAFVSQLAIFKAQAGISFTPAAAALSLSPTTPAVSIVGKGAHATLPAITILAPISLSPGAASSSLVGATPTVAVSASSNKITRSGNQLVMNGSPFRLLGYNMFSVMYHPAWFSPVAGAEGTADNFNAWMDNIKGASPHMNTVRVFGTSQASFNGSTRDWTYVDACLNIASNHGCKIFWTLEDFWDYSRTGSQNPGLSPTGASNFFGGTWQSAILTTEQETYQSWVTAVLNRYHDDPRVAVWEPMNEPNGVTTSWISSVASLIRTYDTTTPIMGSGIDSSNESSIAALSNVDLVGYHYYTDYSQTNWQGIATIANNNSKPWMIGEFGVNQSAGSGRSGQVSSDLTAFFGASNPSSGALYWEYAETGGDAFAITSSSDASVPVIDSFHL